MVNICSKHLTQEIRSLFYFPRSFSFDLKDTEYLVFLNSSDSVFHSLGHIKERVSIPDFILFALGINITFFFSSY